MGKLKQTQNWQRHDFLLTFFKKGNDTVEINGYVLKKYFAGDTKRWQVAIYTKESYSKAQDYLQTQSHLESIKQEKLID